MKYVKYVREHFSNPGFPVIKLYELKTALKAKGIKDTYLKRMINHLIKRGELKRITKGAYTLQKDITTVGFAYQPFYYGLENALTIRKMWEQATNPIIITTKKARPGLRKIGSQNYTIHRIKKNLFFGYELVRYLDFWIPVSDPEKTIIDFAHFNHHLRKDVAKKLKKQVEMKKLAKYLEKYPLKTRTKTLKILNS